MNHLLIVETYQLFCLNGMKQRKLELAQLVSQSVESMQTLCFE